MSIPRFLAVLAFLCSASFPLAAQTPGKTLDFSGMTLTSPTDLIKKPQPQLPEGAPITNFSMHTGSFKEVTLVISDVSYKAGTPMNMDGAIAGAIESLSRLQGVTAVNKVNDDDVKIEGATGRRVSLKINRGEKVLRTETLYIIRDLHMWSIQTVFPADNANGDTVTEELIQSVRLAAPAAAAPPEAPAPATATP